MNLEGMMSPEGLLASTPFTCFSTTLLHSRPSPPQTSFAPSCQSAPSSLRDAGFLGRRGWALEVAARVCREGGESQGGFGRVQPVRRWWQMPLPCMEGVQFAIDTTMASPLHRVGKDAEAQPGLIWRARKERPELTEGSRVRLVVLPGGGPGDC